MLVFGVGVDAWVGLMGWLVRLIDGLVCAYVCVFVLHGLQDGYTPLHFACQQSDNAAVVGSLLDRGADPSAKDGVSVIRPLTQAPITCASLVLWPVLHH